MRNTKISADISKEAKTLLAEYSVKHERSFGWLLDRMIKKFCSDEVEVKTEKPKAKAKRAPANFEECFEGLWSAKGRKGSKAQAKEKFKAYAVDAESSEQLKEFTEMLIQDIAEQSDNLGFSELHLTTYINQKRWER